jgi:hypothetical protein
LKQEALIGRTATFGHEEKLVLVPRDGFDLDLGRQIVSGVLLGEHVEGCKLGIAKVRRLVCVENPSSDSWLIVTRGQNELAFFAFDDCCAGVLAAGQDASGGDVGVLEQFQCDEMVIWGCVIIVEDVG